MRIAVNCWILRNKQVDGIGYFTINTISRIIRAHPEVEFIILCDKNFTEDYFNFPNSTIHRIFPPYRHPALYVFYMEFVLPGFLKKQKPDLLVSTEGFLSLRSECRQVPVIHDINFEHYPQHLKWKNRVYYRYFFKRFAKKAARIATVSEFSKRDIVAHYHVDPNMIDNVQSGINAGYVPLNKDEVQAVRDQYSSGKPYFFFVGSMHPRKNIKGLIAAFNLFKQRTGSDMKLVLAGTIMWSQDELESTFAESRFKEDIVFTGRIDDATLRKLQAAAFALSFVPFFEGFGLPVLEAMECDVPVICSNTTSMPEVAGDAALLVDPSDTSSIADGMAALLNNDELRMQLIEKGKKRREIFSWDKTADLLWECIAKAVRMPFK